MKEIEESFNRTEAAYDRIDKKYKTVNIIQIIHILWKRKK